MASGLKRSRGADGSEPPSVAALRADIASRSAADATPGAWQAAAAAAGVSGADACLCHLGRSIAEALREVTATSETARAKLRSVRASLHAAVDARCDELEELITAAERTKTIALEHELCAVEATLERLRAKRSAAAEAAAALGDADLEAKHAELTARLDDAEAQLLALPTSVVEPPFVGLIFDASELLAAVATSGRVVVPAAVTASDLTLDYPFRHLQPGVMRQIRLLVKSSQHSSQSFEELELSLSAAAAATHLDALLDTRDMAPQKLQTQAVIDAPGRRFRISLCIPESTSVGSSVRLGPLTVAGRAIAGLEEPIVIPVRQGVQVPQQVALRPNSSPRNICISSTGHIYYHPRGSAAVHVLDSDGASLREVRIAGWDLSQTPCVVAVAPGASPLLLVAEVNTASPSRLVAVDLKTSALRWTTILPFVCGGGIAVLPDPDIVATVETDPCGLSAHRLADGVIAGDFERNSLFNSIAADPSSEAVFGDVMKEDSDSMFELASFVWTIDHEQGFFNEVGVIPAAGDSPGPRPLAVVPPAPGKRVSHLVLSAVDQPELAVFALPSVTLVHTHRLEGMQVAAIAADPWGEALAVSDSASCAIHVLAWPLPGMSALE